MENTELTSAIDCTPMSELANYHQQMVEKYKDVTQNKTSPDAQKLMAFNGYYTLNSAAGAFFAVDTNVYVQGSAAPVYDVALLISLDGTTSFRIPFTGTFDGTQLIQQDGSIGLNIALTFARTNGSDGTTATCAGNIKLRGAVPSVSVSGATYNNAIPPSLFVGSYYETVTNNGVKTFVEVMRISNNYQVWYDNGTNSGELQLVPAYVYNLNMYYFSFKQGTSSVGLIMGTAAESGFACNNMVVDSGTTTTRSLLTIPNAAVPSGTPGISSSELAGFSGCYPIQSVAPLAFVSIQAQYITIDQSPDIYTVVITVSMDGTTSEACYFDPNTMTFENNVLSMPQQSITLTLARTYNEAQGSLVTLTGTIKGTRIMGYTLFNPVPLTVFGGVTLTDSQGKTLTIVSDNEIIYCGNALSNFIYVPLMYILAYPITNTTLLLSLGTDGLKGNTCIVTENVNTTPETYFLYAIPDAQ